MIKGNDREEYGKRGETVCREKIKGNTEIKTQTLTSSFPSFLYLSFCLWCSMWFAHQLATCWTCLISHPHSYVLPTWGMQGPFPVIKAPDILPLLAWSWVTVQPSVVYIIHFFLPVLPWWQAQAAFSLIWGGGLCVREKYTRPGWIIQLLSQHGNIRPLSPL